MMGHARSGQVPRLRLVDAEVSAEPPASGVPFFVLDSGFSMCGACGTTLTGEARAGARHYVCDASRGGCGAVRVAAGPFETHVACQALAMLAMPCVLERAGELGVADLAQVTPGALASWWESASFPDRQAMIGTLLDRVCVTPAPGQEDGLIDQDCLAFVWTSPLP